MTNRRAILALSLLAAALIAGPAEFDVASIKPAELTRAGGEGSKRSRIEYSPKSLSMWPLDVWNVTPGDCVRWAYIVRSDQLSGPPFLNDERYDLQATIGTAVPVSQLRIMLQDLLAKRFQLRLRRETLMLPVYEAARGGPRLPPPKADGLVPTHSAESLPRVENGGFVFRDATMPEFAEKLALLKGVELPVVDRTGIPGVFDITLKSAADAIRQPDGPSIFTLLQEQLGLRLVSAKAPVEVLVIENVTRPSPN